MAAALPQLPLGLQFQAQVHIVLSVHYMPLLARILVVLVPLLEVLLEDLMQYHLVLLFS
jgi:hypothetical protein